VRSLRRRKTDATIVGEPSTEGLDVDHIPSLRTGPVAAVAARRAEVAARGPLAHHVSDLVDGLDLTAFYEPYEGDGRRNAPYELRMMVKVLVYAHATGVFSSRRIARKLEENVAFRVLAAGTFPQHRTLCEFRRRHLEDFQALFVEVVRLAQELGLARLGKLSIGGTKGTCEREQAQGDELRPDAERGNSAWKARSRRCRAKPMRLTRPRTLDLQRRPPTGHKGSLGRPRLERFERAS